MLVLGQLTTFAGVAGPEMMKLAGAFVGSIAVFPYREITPREERIATYSFLLRAIDSYDVLPVDERERLLGLVIDAMKETMKR